MTEDLNKVEREQLKQSEIGEDVRYTLKNLSSDDKNLRYEALSELIDEVYHQGTLNYHSAFAVPFLQERLQHESEQELLYEILLALAHLATGRVFSDTHKDVFQYQDRWDTLVFQTWREDELHLVRATREAVHKGVDIYLNLLEHDSPNVRIASVYTLSCCQPDAAQSYARMRLRFHQEPEDLVKASIMLCLAILSSNTPVDTAFLEEVLNSNEADLVKLAAAIALDYIAGENLSDNALEMLVYLLNQPKLFLTLSEHYELPMATAHNLLLINFLTRLNDQHMAKVVPILTQVWGLPHYPELLLELVFQWKTLPEGTTVNDLTEAKQYTLKAIANSTSTGKESIYKSDALYTLRIKGRFTREKLLDFLNGEKLEYDKTNSIDKVMRETS